MPNYQGRSKEADLIVVLAKLEAHKHPKMDIGIRYICKVKAENLQIQKIENSLKNFCQVSTHTNWILETLGID